MPFVFGWLLNSLYLLLLSVIAPVLVFRRMTHGKYRRGWYEKLTGRLTRRHPEKMCLWFHAVSVGEVVQLQKVLEETEARFPDAELFVTVTTETGYDVALSKYPRYTVSFFPLDFSWAVNNALRSIRPSLIVLVELELWPNLILTAHRQQIPLALINGRIGEKSFRGYSRLKPLMRQMLSCFDVLAVQTETYANRLKSLGAPADRVIITGNIKFDGVESNRDNQKTNELRISFNLLSSETVFIAGSTQDPEEAYAVDAWLALRKEFPQLRLIIVPRHKERFNDVAGLIQQRRCHVVRRSQAVLDAKPSDLGQTHSEKPVVSLLDTLGELPACWGLADIAFVGGSLTKRGGQNMIEPAGYGAAVLFGPNTWNFKDIAEALLSQNAARVVTGPDELAASIRQLLQHPDDAYRMGQAARTFVASQRGATRRTADLIEGVVRERLRNETVGKDGKHHSLRLAAFWPTFKWGLFGIVFVAVGRRAIQLWELAPQKPIYVKWPWLLAASLLYFLGGLPCAWFWKSLLSELKQPLDWWNAIRAYYVSQLGKYAPGKALVLVIRGSLAGDAGANPMLAGVAAVYETLVFMATGAALFAAVSPLAFGPSHWNWMPWQLNWLRDQALIVPLSVLVMTIALIPICAQLFSRLARKFRPDEANDSGAVPAISAWLIGQGVAITAVTWCCHAISLGCVLQAVSDAPFEILQFPVWLGACTLATVGGFVVLIAPGGLGVREGLLMEALKDQQQIPAGAVVVAAGLLRVVWFVTEFFAATIFFLAKPSVAKSEP